MDAEAEGERALHALETAPPGAALRQLLAVALSAAAGALAAADAAVLPTAAAALARCEQTIADLAPPLHAGSLMADGKQVLAKLDSVASHPRPKKRKPLGHCLLLLGCGSRQYCRKARARCPAHSTTG